ncbi:MAG: GTPase Era, partial [Hyphomicrobiales bacterium]|nr:GTPase Era [Hyphomicrobiales bacterium]
THKVQTTRSIIRGIALRGPAQIVFVDTPGIFRPRRRLDTAMVGAAWGGARDADLVVLIIDAKKGFDDEVEAILDGLADVRQPKILVINKIDLVARQALLHLTAALAERVDFDATFMVSAMTGDGVGDLLEHLAGEMRPGPWLYPEDQLSDLPMRSLAAEITREKLYLRLHDELPYACHVETEGWQERPDGSVRVDQTIYVERDTQKKILLGRDGQTIKDISMTARTELAEILEQKVHLFLFVKVRRGWGDDPERYREMGLEFPQNRK